MKEDVCFVDVTVFGSTAEAVAKHLGKGRKILVEGRLRFHSWENEVGQRRSKLDVIAEHVNFLPRASKNGNGDSADDFRRNPSGRFGDSVLTPRRLEGLPRARPRKALTLPVPGLFCFHTVSESNTSDSFS